MKEALKPPTDTFVLDEKSLKELKHYCVTYDLSLKGGVSIAVKRFLNMRKRHIVPLQTKLTAATKKRGRRTSVIFDRELRERMVRYCEGEGSSLRALLRTAIKEFLKHRAKRSRRDW